jgi:hypothetical protein
MNQSASSSDQSDTAYNVNREKKLIEARSEMGWMIVFIAAVTVIPSIYDGLRHGVWISRATVSCAALLVGYLLVYRSFSRRLNKLKELGIALDQRVDVTGADVTPAAVQPARHP